MDIFLLILGIILILFSVIGSLIPLIPGPPLGFTGMVLLRFTSFVEVSRTETYDKLLWIFAFITIGVTILDFIVPIWGAKKFSGSKAGMLGAGIGIFAGIFFAPVGLVIMPFIGAVIAETLTGRDDKSSLKAGFGSFIGFLTGVLLKLIVCFLIGFYFFQEIFNSIL